MRRSLLLLLAACGSRSDLETQKPGTQIPVQCVVTSDAPVVLSQEDLGVLSRPQSVRAVSGGQSTIAGGKILWSFSEAFLANPADDGDRWRTSIGASSNAASPLALDYSLDTSGAPRELVPLNDSERTFNKSHSPDETLVVWPMGMVTDQNGLGLIFYSKILAKPGYLNLESLSSGIAIATGQNTAARDPEPLFAEPEPAFGPGALVWNDFVYAYGCPAGFAPEGGCRVARAPIAHARERSAYLVWNGSEWSSDLKSGISLFDWVPGGASVAWHAHLGKFVAFYAEPFSDTVVARTAPRPEGPWSAPITMLHTLAKGDYVGEEQPALQSDCGRNMVVLYYHPRGPFDGELHAVRLRLK